MMPAGFVIGLLKETGFFRWYYGAEFSPPGSDKAANPDQQLVLDRMSLWTGAFAFPLQLGMILFVWLSGRRARLYQLGLGGRRIASNVIAGYVAWLVLALPVYIVFIAISLVLQPEQHPLSVLMEHHPDAVEWTLAVFTAVVAAPVLEELLCRGLLQGWLIQRSWGGNVAVVMALAVAVLACVDRTNKANRGDDGWAAALVRLAPVLFVLATLPMYIFAERLTWRWLPYPYVAQGIYASALLWSMVHVPVWPSPIPLFFLGLGLGYLAYRTQSLIGPMVTHALFNGVACLTLLFGTIPFRP
jgi:membrane protease YdiL (CAAX protease family)